jgi:hypothetical protein
VKKDVKDEEKDEAIDEKKDEAIDEKKDEKKHPFYFPFLFNCVTSVR